MAGSKPMNPIFRNFLKIHEEVDVRNESKWKLWEFSVEVPDRQNDQSNEGPPQPKRPIVVEREVTDDEVDYGDPEESDSIEPDEEAGKTMSIIKMNILIKTNGVIVLIRNRMRRYS